MKLHTQKKFVIYMSVFLSLSLMVLFSVPSDALEKTPETAKIVSTHPLVETQASIDLTEATMLAQAHASNVRAAEAAEAMRLAQAAKSKQSSQANSSSTPAPSPPDPGDGSAVEDAISKAFGSLYSQAYNVARCESTMHPDARNGPNYGLFQISSIHADQWAEVTGKDFYSTWSDPYLNAAFAAWLYDQSGGWGPWSCRWAA